MCINTQERIYDYSIFLAEEKYRIVCCYLINYMKAFFIRIVVRNPHFSSTGTRRSFARVLH